MNPNLIYLPNFLSSRQADEVFKNLAGESDWQQEEIWMFGRLVKQPRLTAWYGLGMSAKSRYTQAIAAAPWTKRLLSIKRDVEEVSQTHFNSCLVNLYRNGTDRMGLHSDNEACLGPDPIIGSISLGASRRFILRRKPAEMSTRSPSGMQNRDDISYRKKITFDLNSGDLLVMGRGVQKQWKHEVPATKKVSAPRINLTFRYLIDF